MHQLQVSENKNWLLIFMLAITPGQLYQEHNSELHRCVCVCFYAQVHICIPTCLLTLPTTFTAALPSTTYNQNQQLSSSFKAIKLL